MGSSKKHKEKDKDREHKRKRKHRSRSPRERDEKKRRHRDREEYDKDNDRRGDHGHPAPDREEGELAEDAHRPNVPLKQEPQSYDASVSTKSDSSLSIQETNRLRAKLGLKPLEMPSDKAAASEEKESLKDDIHVPATNWGHLKKTEKIKERIDLSKKKRQVSEKLSKIKTLGESDSDEDAATWVRKNRMKQREKDKAAKTAKMLEDMDAEFGIGDLVEKEFKSTEKTYTSRDLKGLKVQHDTEQFKEGQTVILTLQDKGVLDENEEETLVNVNMKDDEHAERNVENQKNKLDYKPYDDAEEDEYGVYKEKDVLAKYDEEIHGEKKKSFAIGSGGKYNAEQDREMNRIKDQLRAQAQTLSMGLTKATEYMTPEEMEGKFNKVKKKVRKIRKKKMVKADDLLPLPDEANLGSRSQARVPNSTAEIPGLELAEDALMISDDEGDVVPPDDDMTGVPLEEDEAENELQLALNKARKIKQKKMLTAPEKIALKIHAEKEKAEENSGEEDANIVLNSTSEFCRALGDIPTYGQSGNRNDLEKDDLMELENELLEQRKKMELEEEEGTGWNRVEIDETPIHIEGEKQAVLDDEPIVSIGIAGALELAVRKGFMEHEVHRQVRANKHIMEIKAQNYSIEDKRYDDIDDKYKKRDRYSGMLQEFKEKEGYRPSVKLEYADDSGRSLNEKEAFRQLSHRFHGKGSGKKKTEKRAKKIDEDNLLKTMSSIDTPLNTVALLKEKQLQEKTPYIVLSGNKGFTNTMVKPKT